MPDLDYVTRVHASPLSVKAPDWDALLATQDQPSPFLRHAFLSALHSSACAAPATGWTPRCFTVHAQGVLVAACMLYLKDHSYGEYVFDFAWAQAYAEHGLSYYPKGVVAVPFTPVPGTRLLARDAQARRVLLHTVLDWCRESGLPSLHLLFLSPDDQQACREAGLLMRHGVQFHWTNTAAGYADFDSFLAALSQDKRKKIRQERRKVQEAGVRFRHAQGTDISAQDWDFFYRCYERTYLEHGNPPYLSRDFFQRLADALPEHWLLFIAERDGRPIASSLIATSPASIRLGGQKHAESDERVAYGRYWGALERVDCLHFDLCYYQAVQWCIANGYQRFEGGAQGEHKMSRALLPVPTCSAHWLAHPGFAQAVADFLERENSATENYLNTLQLRSPFRHTS